MDTNLVVDTLALLAGVGLVLVAASDAVSTLVTTRRRRSRLWPTYVFYRRTWRTWRALARRAAPDRRELLLGVYGPLSLLGLLVIWVTLLVAGWGLVWLGLRSEVASIDSYLEAVYFAGEGFFTVGFGDIVPSGDLARLLVLVQAFMGLVTMALVIGYLPTLYGAYSRREVHLLLLDDLSEERTTPAGFLQASYVGGGRDGLAAAFADWERWCAEVFDSHTAYPMLALFRSRQPGQHWLTGLGVVTEAAAICLAAVEGTQQGPAARLYRRATGLMVSFRKLPAIALRVAEGSPEPGDEASFRAVYQRLAEHGVPVRPYEQAWANLRRLRAAYLPDLLAATELLLVPREFRNHSVTIPEPGPPPPQAP